MVNVMMKYIVVEITVVLIVGIGISTVIDMTMIVMVGVDQTQGLALPIQWHVIR